MDVPRTTDFDTTVKRYIYETIADTTAVPTAAEVARSLGSRIGEIEESFGRLHAKHVLVVEQGTQAIRMAQPFSAVETPFRVTVGDKSYYANCVWDALGIPAALHADGDVFTKCGDCGEPMSMHVRNGEPSPMRECAIHYGVPAARWWDDIIYT